MNVSNPWFDLPDLYPSDDPIAMLLGEYGLGDVSGLDYVGAVKSMGVSASQAVRKLQAQGASDEQLRAVLEPLAKLKAQAQAITRIGRDRQLGNASLAGAIPTLPLPVFLHVLVAAPTQDIQAQPTRHMRITKFKVSPDCAPNFNVNRIEISGVNVFAGAGAMQAALFSGDTESPPIQAVELAAGVPAIVNVTLRGGADADFSGVLWGVPLKSV
jgi:hypothetical protein